MTPKQIIVLPNEARIIVSKYGNRVRCVAQEVDILKTVDQLAGLEKQCDEQQRYHEWNMTDRGYVFTFLLNHNEFIRTE